MLKQFSMEDIVNEVKRLMARGPVAVIAWPGWGKTSVLIPSIVEYLVNKSRIVVTTPYHELAKLLYKILSVKHQMLYLAGGHELCLGALKGEFPYVRGLCNVCSYRSAVSLQLPSDPERTKEVALKYNACPYTTQQAIMPYARVLLKTHQFAPPKDALIIADEAHALWLGKLVVIPPTHYCDVDKRELLKELEALKERCFKCVKASQWLSQCDILQNCDVQKIELLEEIVDNECKTLEDGSVIHVRYPRHDNVILALTATPPRRLPKGFEVVEVSPKQKPKLVVIDNVRTTLRDFDVELWNGLVQHLYSVHKGLAVAAPSRVLNQTSLCGRPQTDCIEIWGRRSHGVTVVLPAILVAEPWLSYLAYQVPFGGNPQIATELTLIQMVQILARVRPWTRNAALYAVGPIVLRNEDYFSRLFEIEVAVWDGLEVRKQ